VTSISVHVRDLAGLHKLSGAARSPPVRLKEPPKAKLQIEASGMQDRCHPGPLQWYLSQDALSTTQHDTSDDDSSSDLQRRDRR